MATRGDEADQSRALAPASGPAPLELLREIFRGDPEFSAPTENLPALLANPRFQELVEIVNLAVQIHGSRTAEWFVQPEPELGFVLPATLMRDPANGRKLVKQSLMNHVRGHYVLDENDQVLPRIRPVLTPAPALSGPRKARRPKRKKKPRA